MTQAEFDALAGRLETFAARRPGAYKLRVAGLAALGYLYIVGVLLIVSCALFFASDRAHNWRDYQGRFRQQVAEKFGADKARTIPSGVQQVWIPPLHRADRCITCHQATGWKGFENAKEPFRTQVNFDATFG